MHKRAFVAAIAVFALADQALAQGSDSARARDVLRVARYDLPPYQMVPPSGPSSGFAVDIVKAVARRAGFETSFVTVPSGAPAVDALRDGVVDVLPNVGILASRDSVMDFSRPVYTSRVRIFVRAGTTGIDDGADLAGRRVAVVERNSGMDAVAAIPDALGTTYVSAEAALSALIADRADAMIYPENMLWNVASDLGLQDLVKATGPAVLEVPRALAVREGNDELLTRLNSAIDALLADPEYTEIVRRWFVSPPPYWTVRRLLTWTAVLILLLVIGHHARVWHLNQRLVRSRDQLRALAAHLRALQENEQRVLARELHDEIGQAMVALKMDLSWLREQQSDHDALEARYQEMVALTDSAISVGHRICTRLRPDLLDQLGLEAAVEWAVEDFEARSGIPCTLDVEGCGSVDPEVSTACFRILQEALANVLRHAAADAVEVRLELTGDTVTLEVEDHGCGATREQLERPNALGVLGMRERAAALGGRVRIEGRQGRGTVVRVEIPRQPQPVARA